MKSKYLLTAILAFGLFAGCSKQETSNVEEDDYLIEGTPITTIYAQAVGKDETKVDMKDEGNKTVITWKEGDCITFILKLSNNWRDAGNVYILSSGAGTKHGTFVLKEGSNPIFSGQKYLPTHNVSIGLNETKTVLSLYPSASGYVGDFYVPNEEGNNPIIFKNQCMCLYFNCNSGTYKGKTVEVSRISVVSDVEFGGRITIGVDEEMHFSKQSYIMCYPNCRVNLLCYPENNEKDINLSITYHTNFGNFSAEKKIKDVRPGKGFRFASFTPVIPDYIENGVNHGKGTFMSDINLWVAPFNCGYDEKNYQYGKLYQWGRKYGQGYDDGVIYDYGLVLGDVKKEAAPKDNTQLLNPQDDVFYTSSTGDWFTGESGSHLTKWEYLNEKIDNPCPPGWRLPRPDDGLDKLEYSRGYYCCDNSNTKIYIPRAGFREGNSGTAQGRSSGGGMGQYWMDGGYFNVRENTKISITTYSSSNFHRTSGYSVRCVH